MKYFTALVAVVLTGCGGVMDFTVPPVDIRGDVIGPSVSSIVIATPDYTNGIDDCAKLVASGALDGCSASDIKPERDGTFTVHLQKGMRGCAYLLIPPLLDLFCDYKSYILVGAPPISTAVYLIVIDGHKAKVDLVNPEATSAAFTVEVMEVGEAPNDLGGTLGITRTLVLRLRG